MPAVAGTYAGPALRLVDTISADELARQGGFTPRARPLLIKGALTHWTATKSWSFSSFADLRKKDGSECVTSFQNGLTEQGAVREPLIRPISPYLKKLDEIAQQPRDPHRGLVPDTLLSTLKPGDTFHANWDHLNFPPDRTYLAVWNIFDDFPKLKKDLDIRALWPGLRTTWEYAFIGPADTVTGLHNDYPDNWFCQFRGVKEFVLFPPENKQFLSPSTRFDSGGEVCHANVTNLSEPSPMRDRFAQANGLYARVERGDALFIPKKTWHAVIALEPSISVGVFGLSIPELITAGIPSLTRDILHACGLYQRGNCTCHRKPGSETIDPTPKPKAKS
jgi:hypothetical protein